MDHIETIKALGGAKVVSDELKARGIHVAPVTVRSWTLRGRMIPSKYWLHIAEIASGKCVDVSFEALAEQAAA